MIDLDRIWETVELLSTYTADELEQYKPFASKNLLLVCDGAQVESEADESRLVFYAAAKTNYEIALAKNCADHITSFTAGDVTVVEDGDMLLAKEMYLSAKSDAAGIVEDDDFVFMDV